MVFYLPGKNKGHLAHGPACEAGQDHGKNDLKERRFLYLGKRGDPGTLPNARKRAQGGGSDGGFTRGKAGRTGKSYP